MHHEMLILGKKSVVKCSFGKIKQESRIKEQTREKKTTDISKCRVFICFTVSMLYMAAGQVLIREDRQGG